MCIKEVTIIVKKAWDHKFDVLAHYNSEVLRGLTHTEEYSAKMSVLQEEYDTWIRSK